MAPSKRASFLTMNRGRIKLANGKKLYQELMGIRDSILRNGTSNGDSDDDVEFISKQDDEIIEVDSESEPEIDIKNEPVENNSNKNECTNRIESEIKEAAKIFIKSNDEVSRSSLEDSGTGHCVYLDEGCGLKEEIEGAFNPNLETAKPIIDHLNQDEKILCGANDKADSNYFNCNGRISSAGGKHNISEINFGTINNTFKTNIIKQEPGIDLNYSKQLINIQKQGSWNNTPASYFNMVTDKILGEKQKINSYNKVKKMKNKKTGKKSKNKVTSEFDLIKLRQQILRKRTCRICGEISPTAAVLNQHVKIHYTFTCVYCDHLFLDQRRLDNHISTVHTSGQLFPCDQCDREYLTANRLKHHKQYGHYNGKCPLCDRVFTNEVGMLKHLGNHKFTKKCPICGLRLFNDAQYDIHMDMCHKEQCNFSCCLCDKRFIGKLELDAHVDNAHQQSYSDEQYTCNYCYNQFTSRFLYEQHIDQHLETNNQDQSQNDDSGFGETSHFLCGNFGIDIGTNFVDCDKNYDIESKVEVKNDDDNKKDIQLEERIIMID